MLATATEIAINQCTVLKGRVAKMILALNHDHHFVYNS